jgi:DNA repair protein RadC
MKQWLEEERPREKLLVHGADALSNVELLAIILNTGTADRSVMDIAQELLSECNHNLSTLGTKSLRELQTIKGIGVMKAVTLMATLELGKRRLKANASLNSKLNSSQKLFEVFQPLFLNKQHEAFAVLYMNNLNHLIHVHQLHEGSINKVHVDVRLIFKKAMELPLVTRIALAHNHPSGELDPSQADRMLTRRIKELGSMCDIQLIDHLIIHENKYFSFHDADLLQTMG